MSKIIINEVDETSAEQSLDIGYDVVFVPGFSSVPVDSQAGTDLVDKPTLCTSVAQFERYFGSEPALFVDPQSFPSQFSPKPEYYMFEALDVDPSYIYAKELLQAGVPVVYQRLNQYTQYDSNYDVTVENFYNKLSTDVFGSTRKVLKERANDIFQGTFSLDHNIYLNNTSKDGTNEFKFHWFKSYQVFKKNTKYLVGDIIKASSDPLKYTDYYQVTQAIPSSNNRDIYDLFINGYVKLYTSGDYYDASDSEHIDNNHSVGEILKVNEKFYLVVKNMETDSGLAGNAIELTSNNSLPIPAASWFLNNEVVIPTLSSIEEVYGLEFNPLVMRSRVEEEVTFYSANKGNLAFFNSDVYVCAKDFTDVPENELVEQGELEETSSYLIPLTGNGASEHLATLGSIISITSIIDECKLVDKDQYNIKYITSGGYPVYEYNGNSIVNQMTALAKQRGDCIALIDHTNIPGRDLLGSDSLIYAVQNNIVPSSEAVYSSMFTPWGRYSVSASYGTDIDLSEGINLPASFAYLMCLANSIANNPSWYSIAGASRGRVPHLMSVDTERPITNSVANVYQNNDSVSINPITYIAPYGQCIWGNRTLLDNSVKRGTTALSFLNIRNMVCDIKKQVYIACQTLMFDQNTEILWNNFTSMITPLLDSMVTGSGLKSYQIIRLESSEKSTIRASIRVYPVYAVEAFEITLYLSDNEVTVE